MSARRTLAASAAAVAVAACALLACGAPRHFVPMAHVLQEGVVGRQVEAAAEVPVRLPHRRIVCFHKEKPQVHVCRGRVRVARMDDDRNRGRLKRPSRQMRIAFGGGRRQGGADAVGELHGSLLQAFAALEHSRSGNATTRQVALFAHEPRDAVDGLEVLDEPPLQTLKEGAHRRDVRWGRAQAHTTRAARNSSMAASS